MAVTLLGVRHHGPGSARAVRAALEELRPDAVLVEGPPEATPLLRHLPDLVPPVALLVADSSHRRRAGLWPFAAFSPEWQALTWAHAHDVEARLVDLPQVHALAEGTPTARDRAAVRADPLGWLARAAGHDDAERWWEDVVEHRGVAGAGRQGSGAVLEPLELFAAVAEAMTETRAAAPSLGVEADPRDALREAAMRQQVRAVGRAGAERVVVVCGAWHVPALADPPPVRQDQALLRGLPKVPVTATWVPWTSPRLAQSSGYGAGVTSPGWYAHLFTAPDRVVERWVARVVAVLRDADLPASTATAVDAVRLAEALATLRGRSVPGLTEVDDAVLSALCGGDPAPLAVVRDRLTVGDDVGRVPDDVPTVPLAADLEAAARRLRLRREATVRHVTLDLRTSGGLARSRLLHRLRVLDVHWGRPGGPSGAGTFREEWRLLWRPELAVDVLDAATWGTTVEAAATARLVDRAAAADGVDDLTAAVEQSVLADLPGALPALVDALDGRAAHAPDAARLLRALGPLARVLRYGDVRGTDARVVAAAFDGLLARAAVALPGRATGLAPEPAAELVQAVEQAHDAVALAARPEQADAWTGALAATADAAGGTPLVVGRCTRLLLDAGHRDARRVARELARALSAGRPAVEAAGWLEGFLQGSGLLLVGDPTLFALVDDWLVGLDPDRFVEVLPLVRRAFGVVPPVERRLLGRHVATASDPTAQAVQLDDWDPDRLARVLPVLRLAVGAGPS